MTDQTASTNEGWWVVAQVVAVVALLALVAALMFEWVDADRAIPVLLALIGAVVIAVSTPGNIRDLIANTESLSLGPFAINLIRDVEQAVDEEPADEGEAAPPDVLGLHLRIERKLAYIAKHMLPDDDDAPAEFVTIGSLCFDKYLDDEHARLALRILTLRDEELKGLGPAEKKEFLANAAKLAARIRAYVLHGQMRRKIETADGWSIDVIDNGRMRPDILAIHGRHQFRLRSVFVEHKGGEGTISHHKDKLVGKKTVVDRRAVVIPNNAEQRHCMTSDAIDIVKPRDLPGALLR